jgi:hypothetical protein
VRASKSNKTSGNTQKLRLVLGRKPNRTSGNAKNLRLVHLNKSNKTSGNTHFLIILVALLPRIAALALKQLLPLGYPAMPLSIALQALLRCCAIWLVRPMILVWDSTITTCSISLISQCSVGNSKMGFLGTTTMTKTKPNTSASLRCR